MWFSVIATWPDVLLHFYSSDVGQREQEKSRLEKQYQESDRRLDNLIQGLDKTYFNATYRRNLELPELDKI